MGYKSTHVQLVLNLFNPWIKWVEFNLTHI